MPDFVTKYKWYIIGAIVTVALFTALWNGGV